jgi:hypothetical protein
MTQHCSGIADKSFMLTVAFPLDAQQRYLLRNEDVEERV